MNPMIRPLRSPIANEQHDDDDRPRPPSRLTTNPLIDGRHGSVD